MDGNETNEHAEYVNELVKRVEEGMDKPAFQEELNQAVDNARRWLENVVADSNNETVIVVGGKSRTTTEILLSEAINRSNNPNLKNLYKARIRLNEDDNQFYKEIEDPFAIITEDSLPEVIKNINRQKEVTFIFVDDHGKHLGKAGNTLDTLDELRLDARYLLFATPEEPADNRIYSASTRPLLNDVVEGVSLLTSEYARVRLKEPIAAGQRKGDVSIDDLHSGHASSLRTANDFNREIRELLAQ